MLRVLDCEMFIVQRLVCHTFAHESVQRPTNRCATKLKSAQIGHEEEREKRSQAGNRTNTHKVHLQIKFCPKETQKILIDVFFPVRGHRYLVFRSRC